jgi:hypothetical protein
MIIKGWVNKRKTERKTGRKTAGKRQYPAISGKSAMMFSLGG